MLCLAAQDPAALQQAEADDDSKQSGPKKQLISQRLRRIQQGRQLPHQLKQQQQSELQLTRRQLTQMPTTA